ncbi:MAG: hypothetical protein JSS86_08600 [Cyanobacteria bacterium SZAS LIN-2]|nr:hypothetical protein [Cyanobacteria bacterium SZAS LIN-2]MBS2007957.1 hypothetical protein [Cyanobacteria bacterium SZAS TMP-1]
MTSKNSQAIQLTVAAHCNDSVSVIGWCWTGGAKIANCLGFSLTRINKAGVREIINTYLPFEGQDNRDWKSQPSTVWPIQRTFYLDFTGKVGETYTYEVEALEGTVGALTPIAGLKGTSNAVTLSTKVTDYIHIGFTRGVLSTQWLAHMIGLDKDGNPDFQKIIDALEDYANPNNVIRRTLVGNVPAMLMAPVTECVTDGGHVDAAIYELASKQLVDFFLKHIKYFSMVLGNTGPIDETNAPARAALHAANADVMDRMIGAWGIAHNKFQIKKNAQGVPTDVTTGSTNLTDTGMGCQSNMVIRIIDAQIAAHYEDYFTRLKADNSQQSLAFRQRNAQGYAPVTLPDGTVIETYFQPSMNDKTKPKGVVPLSPFLNRVKGLIEDAAKDGDSIICGEVFYPGNPSVVQWMAENWDNYPSNYMFLTVSTPDALRGVTAKRRKGRPPLFTIAQGREKDFADFVKELLKLPEAHAITHGKIIVIINPRTKKYIVIGGSDNLGAKASYGNDENAFIIFGNEAVAWATFVNMFDINKHYASRAAARANRTLQKAVGWTGKLSTNDTWQSGWVTGYKAKEARMLATGVWDGTGLVDPPGLKSVPVIPAPRRKPAGSGATTSAPAPVDPAAPATAEPADGSGDKDAK